jgi:serine/threonine-protein kinase RsbW
MEARIGNRREDMPVIVAMVERFGAEHKLPSAEIHELHVVLDEVLSNIIGYAYGEGERGEILVRMIYRPDEVLVDIEDTGTAFDPLQVSQPDLTLPLKDRKIGGVGIHFIKSLMDEVAYARLGGINRLRLRKKLPPPSAPF